MRPAPTIGIVGNDVPRQLVSAAGAVPRRLTGSWSGPIGAEAAAHLGAVDPVTARILTELLGPDAPALDAIVVCNDSQAHLRLFYVLRMLGDRGIPPVHLVDLPRQEDAATRRFAQVQFTRLAEFCSRVTGVQPGSSAWRRAAAGERAVGDALTRLRGRRRAQPAGTVSGTAALQALLTAASVAPEDAVLALDAAEEEPDAASLRVHVTGSNHPDTALYVALERQGVTVVSEDHDTGDLSWLGVAVDGDDLATVTQGLVAAHFRRSSGSAVSTIAERASLCRTSAETAGAQGVLALVRAGDEAPLWDLAASATVLGAAGMPLVRRRGLTPENVEAALADIAAELRTRGGEPA
ncbi:2-hydroxyacyl-CoA dehydratase [Microbacterium caowuchunii]|uniref:2-hydroxyacyl-CoA dehydratase family protein n=1 Tax=Microbacterium caowuchunii TaxID=2614638 RepID=UPI00124629AA|nr:2-hydroxyacyl-CoA dehydratase family protein [Microbacterium caowuchunii]QEW01166.1 2-hydroxyacyl-CoA dehydratase [Microbacterium caowuchunii]